MADTKYFQLTYNVILETEDSFWNVFYRKESSVSVFQTVCFIPLRNKAEMQGHGNRKCNNRGTSNSEGSPYSPKGCRSFDIHGLGFIAGLGIRGLIGIPHTDGIQ